MSLHIGFGLRVLRFVVLGWSKASGLHRSRPPPKQTNMGFLFSSLLIDTSPLLGAGQCWCFFQGGGAELPQLHDPKVGREAREDMGKSCGLGFRLRGQPLLLNHPVRGKKKILNPRFRNFHQSFMKLKNTTEDAVNPKPFLKALEPPDLDFLNSKTQ